MGSQTHYNLEHKLACLYKFHDFGSIDDYEDVVELEHELELSLNKLRARKVSSNTQLMLINLTPTIV